MLLRLALSNFRVHKMRFALTAAAVTLSVSLVVAVTSGYATAEGAAKYFLNKYLGSTVAEIMRQGPTPMPQSWIDDLR
jgi:ABC-type antimicrobial peptide transport system permease subunit